MALKGLQLAANDAERGVIGQRQLERVRNTINALIRELAEYGDQDLLSRDIQRAGTPKDPRDMEAIPRPKIFREILCFRSRGKDRSRCYALPGGGRSMKRPPRCWHNFWKSMVWATGDEINAASRDAINSLDVTGIAMICVAYLDIRGNPRIFDTFCSD